MTKQKQACRNKVCKECPFRRKSIPGYLGESSHKPEEFLAPHYTFGESPLPCHMAVNWEQGEPGVLHSISKAPLCRGFLIFVKNSVKRFHDPALQKLVDAVEPDHVNIFSWPHEFIAHHKKPDWYCNNCQVAVKRITCPHCGKKEQDEK